MSTVTPKITLNLQEKEDWWLWFVQVKNYARHRDVWQYMDTKDNTPEPPRPTRPRPADLGADSLIQIEERGRMSLWRQMVHEYELDKHEYDSIRQNLLAIKTAILASIPKHYQGKLESVVSLREILQVLSARFEPTIEEQYSTLNAKFSDISTLPPGKAVLTWLKEWKEFAIEVECCPGYDKDPKALLVPFYEAGRPKLDTFVSIKQMELMKRATAELDVLEEICQYEDRYKSEYKAIKRNAYGTFQGRKEGNGSSNSTKTPNSSHPKRKDDCLCGQTHRFKDCPYVDPAHRPAHWVADPNIAARFTAPLPPPVQQVLDNVRNKVAHRQTRDESPQNNPIEQHAFFASFAVPSSDYELRDSWIADSGSDTHVCNNLSRFRSIQPCSSEEELRFGNNSTPILGFGSVTVVATKTQGEQVHLNLANVAFIPDFHTNIVSMQLSKHAGLFIHPRLNRIENRHGNFVCQLHSIHSQDVIEYNPIKAIDGALTLHAFANQRSASEPHSTASSELWHARLAHASTAAINQLVVTAEGVALPPCTHVNASNRCEICKLAKAQRQISRRNIPPAPGPWEKVFFDFLTLTPPAYNGDRFCLHFVCSRTNWHVAVTMPNKDQIRVVRIIRNLANWAKTQMGATIKMLFSDNDSSLGLLYTLLAEDLGIQIMHSAHYADSQHGKPERAGGVISTRMRSMLINARLPESLWPLATQAATYLINRTPTWTKSDDGSHVWTTPFERMFGQKPNLANL